MKTYYVQYRMYQHGDLKGICVAATNKHDAYMKAVYQKIRTAEGGLPYSAFVSSVTYSNGNYHEFNTFEGNPY